MFVYRSKVSVFADHNNKSEQIDELIYGDKVRIIDRCDGFLKIITDYGYGGWIIDNTVCDFESSPTHYISSSFADVLTIAEFFHKPFFTLPFGANVEIIGEDARFAICKTPLGEGYIHKSHLLPIKEINAETELRDSLVSTAKAFLGVQYRWGGRTFSGIDCSGLCFNAYRFNRINIWRDADITRSPNLRTIDYKTAKKGDLLFFKGHIAMYLGRGMIIHSSASRGKVDIENYENNDYLKEIYICTGTVF